ncbi:hypothetical protein N9M98_01915 [Candidatus Pseudothioglobus singularis]|jgi:hypothetical protein|nr:hypothetical protein [Candidatus Pseudothioglobus singularis]
MTKKTRKGIVFSLVYEIVAYILVSANFWDDDFIIAMILVSSPVFIYWARVFIKAGD